jgi:hypothetical protein
VIDRDYFWAIYFRTPGGVLFEVATNEPGFDRDEDTAHLGSSPEASGAARAPARGAREVSRADRGLRWLRRETDRRRTDARLHLPRHRWGRDAVPRLRRAGRAGGERRLAPRRRLRDGRAALLSSGPARGLRHGGPRPADGGDGGVPAPRRRGWCDANRGSWLFQRSQHPVGGRLPASGPRGRAGPTPPAHSVGARASAGPRGSSRAHHGGERAICPAPRPDLPRAPSSSDRRGTGRNRRYPALPRSGGSTAQGAEVEEDILEVAFLARHGFGGVTRSREKRRPVTRRTNSTPSGKIGSILRGAARSSLRRAGRSAPRATTCPLLMMAISSHILLEVMRRRMIVMPSPLSLRTFSQSICRSSISTPAVGSSSTSTWQAPALPRSSRRRTTASAHRPSAWSVSPNRGSRVRRCAHA